MLTVRLMDWVFAVLAVGPRFTTWLALAYYGVVPLIMGVIAIVSVELMAHICTELAAFVTRLLETANR